MMRRAVFRCASASPYQSSQPCEKKNQTAAALNAARHTATTAVAAIPLERRAGLELAIPGLDFIAGERAETVNAEFLPGEAAHHRAIDSRAPPVGHLELSVRSMTPREISDEAAGERIACTGRIENIL